MIPFDLVNKRNYRFLDYGYAFTRNDIINARNDRKHCSERQDKARHISLIYAFLAHHKNCFAMPLGKELHLSFLFYFHKKCILQSIFSQHFFCFVVRTQPLNIFLTSEICLAIIVICLKVIACFVLAVSA